MNTTSGFQPMSLGGFNAGQAVIPPVIPPSSGLSPKFEERADSLVQNRLAIVVRLGHLGSHVCVGILRDYEPLVEEDSLTYGVARTEEVRALEATLDRTL